MERMTVYRLMAWLENKPAGTEVRLAIPGTEGLTDIIGLDGDPAEGTLWLEAEEPELEGEDTEDGD